MVIASPRASFRGLTPVPEDWGGSNSGLAGEVAALKDHMRTAVKAIKQLQEIARHYPIEIVPQSADYTMVDIDQVIVVDATGGNKTITLLTAAGREGRRIGVKKTDSSANSVTIDAEGSQKLDGFSTVALTSNKAYREYVSDGTNWILVSSIGYATETP